VYISVIVGGGDEETSGPVGRISEKKPHVSAGRNFKRSPEDRTGHFFSDRINRSGWHANGSSAGEKILSGFSQERKITLIS